MTTYFPGILSNGALVPGLAAGTVRNTLGLGTADSPTFAGGTFTGNLQGAELRAVGVSSTTRVFQSGGFGVLANQSVNIAQWATTEFNSYGRIGLRIATAAVYLDTDAAHALAQRNGVNAQSYNLYKTYTSSTSNERLAFDTTAAGFYDIVAARGSAGGAENGIRIGSKQDGGSFVPWVQMDVTPSNHPRLTVAGARPVISGNLTFCTEDGVGFEIYNHHIIPAQSFGLGARDNLTDLGISYSRFRDLWLGRNLIMSPTESRTLAANLQFTIERVSNTEINLVYRGDDGTTRRLALPGFA